MSEKVGIQTKVGKVASLSHTYASVNVMTHLLTAEKGTSWVGHFFVIDDGMYR